MPRIQTSATPWCGETAPLLPSNAAHSHSAREASDQYEGSTLPDPDTDSARRYINEHLEVLKPRFEQRLPGLKFAPPRLVFCDRREFDTAKKRDWFNASIGLSPEGAYPKFSPAPTLAWQIVTAPLQPLLYLVMQAEALFKEWVNPSGWDQVAYLPSTGELRVRKGADEVPGFTGAFRTALAVAALDQRYPQHLPGIAHLMRRGYSQEGDQQVARQCRRNALGRTAWTLALAHAYTAPSDRRYFPEAAPLQKKLDLSDDGLSIIVDMTREKAGFARAAMEDPQVLDATSYYVLQGTKVLTAAGRRAETLAKLEAVYRANDRERYSWNPFEVMELPRGEVPNLE